MTTSQMTLEIEYLLGFLGDELRGFSDVQIRPVFPTGTRRSVDLVQDYDPESSDLHVQRGVRVRARSRDYFFPSAWVAERRNDLVHEQAREIREYLETQDARR
jgi:hypothetical protein